MSDERSYDDHGRLFTPYTPLHTSYPYEYTFDPIKMCGGFKQLQETTMSQSKSYIITSGRSVHQTYSTLEAAERYATTLADANPDQVYTVGETKSSFKLRNILPVDKKVHI